MTIIITPVGTSLFTNGGKVNSTIANISDAIKDKREDAWDDYSSFIELLRSESERFIDIEGISASAELQSSTEIQNALNHAITVRLIATDTIASRLAAEVLLTQTSTVLNNQVSVEFDYRHDVIRGLQVESATEFSETGIRFLFERLNSIRGNIEDNNPLAVNITGGYGATVPILTVFARINRVPLYYYFENATELIEIQNILARAHLV